MKQYTITEALGNFSSGSKATRSASSVCDSAVLATLIIGRNLARIANIAQTHSAIRQIHAVVEISDSKIVAKLNENISY